MGLGWGVFIKKQAVSERQTRQAWGGVVGSSYPGSCTSVVTPQHLLGIPSTSGLLVVTSRTNLFPELPKRLLSQSFPSRVMALSANPDT